MTTPEKTCTIRTTHNAQRTTHNAQRTTHNAQRTTYMHAQNSEERIHIALAVYDPKGTYSQHAGVVMTSIFENTSSPVTIHVFHDDTLTQDNRKKFIRTAEKYSQEVNFIDITEQSAKIGERVKKVSEQWTIGTLYRMFIPQALPEIDKVIYLDCDIVVNLDIRELWDIDMENKSLIGVFDRAVFEYSKFSLRGVLEKLCGADVKHYINAGVTVMNLKKFRALGDFCELSIKWLSQHAHLPIFPDQDALNSIFAGDIKFVDMKFNVYDLSKDLSNSIIHMHAGKPWESFTGREHEKIYWRMYIKSAWGEDYTVEDIIDKLAQINSQPNAIFIHTHGGQCVRRLKISVLVRLPRKLAIFTIPYMLLKDFIYRIKYKFLY